MEREIHAECIRNRAAKRGYKETDGCSFFSAHPLYPTHCACCGCHLNFHRKVVVIDLNADDALAGGDGGAKQPRAAAATVPNVGGIGRKLRFTERQKAAVKVFAERLGWTLKYMKGFRGEREIKKFCEKIGVSKLRFKIWMHNKVSFLAV